MNVYNKIVGGHSLCSRQAVAEELKFSTEDRNELCDRCELINNGHACRIFSEVFHDLRKEIGRENEGENSSLVRASTPNGECNTPRRGYYRESEGTKRIKVDRVRNVKMPTPMVFRLKTQDEAT